MGRLVRTQLLILDLNGVLYTRQPLHNNVRFRTEQLPHFVEPLTLRLKNHVVYTHPEMRSILDTLIRRYEVGIFSSTPEAAAARNLRWLYPEKWDAYAFRWYRDRTRYDPAYGVRKDIMVYDTIKQLEDVWTCPSFGRKYHAGNTVIVDDSPQKLRFNPRGNTLTYSVFYQSKEEGQPIVVFREPETIYAEVDQAFERLA